MFHWICPECGREIPPQVKECPVCDLNAAASTTPETTPAPILEAPAEIDAQTAPPEPPPAIAEPVAAEPVAAEPVAAEPVAAESVAAEPVAEAPQAFVVAEAPVESVPELAVAVSGANEIEPAVPEPVLAEAVASEQPVPAPAGPPPPVPDSIPDPLLRLAQKLRETQRELELAAASGHPPVAPSVLVATKPLPPPIQTPHVDAQPLATAPVLLLEAAPGAIALLAPPELLAEPVAEPVAENHAQAEPSPELVVKPEHDEPEHDEPEHDEPGHEPAPEPEPIAIPASAGRIGRPEPSLMVSAPAPKPLDLEALLAPVRAPQRDAVRNAPTPAALGLGPLQDSTAIGSRIRPAEQAALIQKSQPGPSITLPGPALPRALNSLKDAGISKILTDRPKAAKKTALNWVTGLIAAIVVMSCLVGFEMYTATRDSTPARPAAHVTAPESVQAAPIPTEPAAAVAYPLSKSVEVTGLRFVGENASELRYLVVNHSAMDLNAVTLYVTVRSAAAKPGQPPLYRFSFRTPSLGPLESKEMSTTLDKPLHAGADWQGLHADVEVGQ